MLDCKRKIPPPHGIVESIEDKNKRIAAQWDSDCSFEADDSWVAIIQEKYGIPNLVNSEGEPTDEDAADEADMCEMIRAAVAARKFPEFENPKELDPKFVSMIKCVGAEEQTQICAANERSFFDEKGWFILLDGMGMQFGGNPSFDSSVPKKEDDEEEKKDDKGDEEESDEERNKRIDQANKTQVIDSLLDENNEYKKPESQYKFESEEKDEETNPFMNADVTDPANILTIAKCQLPESAHEDDKKCEMVILLNQNEAARAWTDQPKKEEPVEGKPPPAVMRNLVMQTYGLASVSQEFDAKMRVVCERSQSFFGDTDNADMRMIGMVSSKELEVVTVDADPGMFMGGVDAASPNWQESGLEMIFDPAKTKMDFLEKDGYAKQPVLYIYNFQSEMVGTIEFFISHSLVGSNQVEDKNPRQLTYTLGVADERLSLTGYGFGLIKTDDTKKKKYKADLKVKYEGETEFGEDMKTTAKLTAFMLPFKFLHKSLEFGDWVQPIPTDQSLYTQKLGQWQDMFGFNSAVSFELTELSSQFKDKSNKVKEINILILYTITFKCPVGMPAPSFRLMYKFKGKDEYVQGTMMTASHNGKQKGDTDEIRSVNGLGYISGPIPEIEIFAQVYFQGEDKNYTDMFKPEEEYNFFDNDVKEKPTRENFPTAEDWENVKIGRLQMRTEMFATAMNV